MAQILPNQVALSSGVLFQELDGEGLFLHLESENYYGLDEVGMRMWQLMEQHGDLASVVAQLLKEYDVDGETLRQDLANLVTELAENDLLTITS